jgi:putative holliday junction resolvase
VEKGRRILGVDFGLARIGLAISDKQHIIASPLENITVGVNQEGTIEKFLKELEKLRHEKNYDISLIVVGLPLKFDGTDSTTTSHVRSFVEKLKEKCPIAVVLFDERLTSVQADRTLLEVQFTRKKRAQFIDRISATILLQSYLDKIGAET